VLGICGPREQSSHHSSRRDGNCVWNEDGSEVLVSFGFLPISSCSNFGNSVVVVVVVGGIMERSSSLVVVTADCNNSIPANELRPQS